MTYSAKPVIFAVLVVVDIVLIGLMFQKYNDDANLATSSSSPLAKPVETSSQEAEKPTGAAKLWSGEDGSLVRSRMGNCSATGRPLLEASYDGGANFSEIAVPILSNADANESPSKAESVRTILRVDVEPDGVTVVTGDASCDPQQYTSTDGGGSWTRNQQIDGWYVDAALTGVVSPAGPSEPGCAVTVLEAFSDSDAKVMCAGGTTRTTTDGGDTWLPLGRLGGVKAATFADPQTGYAIADDTECTRAFASTDGGATWTAAGCTDGGHSALVIGSQGLIATDGRNVQVSTDRGVTWEKP